MLKPGTLSCTEADLYAAKCSVVHSFTPDSDLTKAGKARVIGYAFGSANVDKLDQAAVFAGQSDQVNVHVRTP